MKWDLSCLADSSVEDWGNGVLERHMASYPWPLQQQLSVSKTGGRLLSSCPLAAACCILIATTKDLCCLPPWAVGSPFLLGTHRGSELLPLGGDQVGAQQGGGQQLGVLCSPRADEGASEMLGALVSM